MNNEENTSAVLLSLTMKLNDVRETCTNYEKTYVYYYSNDFFVIIHMNGVLETEIKKK